MSETRSDVSSWPNPTRSPNYQILYSNISRTILTPWDISLNLGHLIGTTPPSVQELAVVVFSPQQFKALAVAFSNTIRAYEERFGAVNLNPDLIQSPEAMKQAMEDAEKRAI